MKTGKRIWEDYWKGDEDHSWWTRPAPDVAAFIQSQSPAERPDVLDLGCGLGRHAIAFAQAGFSVTAADVSETAVDRLSERARSLSLEIRAIVCDALCESLANEGFDIVLAYNVIYHGYRHQFASAIAGARRLLRKNGLFYFTCPSRDDGKYGSGLQVAPHTFMCEKSVTPGDIHYFAGEDDLNESLAGFVRVETDKSEGYWDNKGTRQFYSFWRILARKP